MRNDKNKMRDKKIISFEEITREKALKEPIFSEGLYNWVMFLISLYSRVRTNLKIDFESFIILQVVVSHSLYELNKNSKKTYSELEEEITNVSNEKKTKISKLTFASISEVLQLPRETVRRKILELSKSNILEFSSSNGIKLGIGYKTIYKEFVGRTTNELSSLLKKWKRTGALENLLELDKKL